ncbi:MAG: efflux RND transporter periplasmic adaptor subunit [Bdellovibrio sp.]
MFAKKSELKNFLFSFAAMDGEIAGKQGLSLRKVFFCNFFFTLLFACTKEPPHQNKAEKISNDEVEVTDLRHLKVVALEKKEFRDSLPISGRIMVPEKDIVQLTMRVQGRVNKLEHVAGDFIKEGEVLLEVWSPDLATAATEWFTAKRQGQRDLQRLSESKLSNLGFSAKDIASENQEKFPLRSPLSGVILERKVNNGASVQYGDLVFTLGKIGRYEFVGDIPPEDALKLKPGLQVVFPEYDTLKGSLTNVAPIADSQTRLSHIRARIEGPLPNRLFVESLVKAFVILKTSPEWVIPSSSIVRSSQGEAVYINSKERPHVFKRVSVRLVSRQEQESAIQMEDWLKSEVRVVSQGALQLEALLEDD